uniref:Putative secreted peptide n=1 Tax=Anopheles braziliensis TaxID=58242 RepID=A0A2M3ZXL1_9DIPT
MRFRVLCFCSMRAAGLLSFFVSVFVWFVAGFWLVSSVWCVWARAGWFGCFFSPCWRFFCFAGCIPFCLAPCCLLPFLVVVCAVCLRWWPLLRQGFLFAVPGCGL